MKTAIAGMVLGTSLIWADLNVEDFTNWVGINKGGGLWLADGDVYSGGTSTVTEPTTEQDLIKNAANIIMTYDDATKSIISHIKVSANVPGKDWAYAGWVMDFKPVDTTGSGKPPWELAQWERKNEVNVSGCDALQITMQFTANKQLWIELYNPFQERDKPLAPQYGWRFYEPTGGMVTKTFKLSGLGGPVTKWTDPANTIPKDFSKVNRIKILYEGQVGGAVAVPAPFDSAVHTLTFASVKLIGGANCVIPGFPTADAIMPNGSGKAGMEITSAPGRMIFGNLATLGELRVNIRDLKGKTVAAGVVNGEHPALDVSSLKNGVYAIQVLGSRLQRSFSITVLN